MSFVDAQTLRTIETRTFRAGLEKKAFAFHHGVML